MTITLTREEAQQVLDALDEYRDSIEDFRVANRCISLIETLRARLSALEPEHRDVVIKGDLWRIEFLPDHAASVVLVRANYEAQPDPEPVAGYRWEEGRTPPSVTFTAPPQPEPPCKTGSQCIGGKCLQCVVPEPVGWIYEDDEGRMMFSQMPTGGLFWEPVYRKIKGTK